MKFIKNCEIILKDKVVKGKALAFDEKILSCFGRENGRTVQTDSFFHCTKQKSPPHSICGAGKLKSVLF